MTNSTSKQEGKKGNNPQGIGGFRDNPQNRSTGHWKKEDTPRFKLEQMMKLDEEALLALAKDKSAPYFERMLAVAIADKNWKTTKEIIHEVYGTPKQSLDVTSGGDKIKTVVEIIDARSKSTDT